jgi:N-carbamoyl-D-amino-acid hydrolase
VARSIRVAVAQTGPVLRADSREAVVARLMDQMRQAADRGARFVVFPELALTFFFPRLWMEDEAEIDSWFEREMPGPATRPLFELAQRLGLGFNIGYAELTEEGGAKRRYNTSIIVNRAGRIVGKYRKIHLPGRAHKETTVGWHNFEKRYFDVGDRSWPVWRTMGVNMGTMICNDRRWPEAYRVMGLQSVELIALGYNSSIANARGGEPPEIRMLHNHISMQAGAYQNASWVCGAAKSGDEEGIPLMGGSAIIAPTGQIVAQASRLGPEVITAECDLDLCAFYKRTMFDFAAHRRPEHYRMIVERTGAEPPPAADDED